MRQVVLVAGPPCAGKSTYVAQRRQPGDIVLDQDAIGADAFKRGLTKVGLMRAGRAWVIRCAPGAQARAALAAKIRATEVVLLAPAPAVLFSRGAARANPARVAATIREWLRREQANRPPMPEAPPYVRRSSTTERGYGAEHRAARRRLLPGAYGQLCPRCGHPMMPGQALDLDHTDDRRSYLGFSHASCNRRAGARKRNSAAEQRKPIVTSQAW
jgi:hypothetical protein